MARRLRYGHGILTVLDGSKALRKAVAKAFGERALIQRFALRTRPNVIGYLPVDELDVVDRRLTRQFDVKHPDAASPCEGRLLDVVPGRSGQVVRERAESHPWWWADGVDVSAIDAFRGYPQHRRHAASADVGERLLPRRSPRLQRSSTTSVAGVQQVQLGRRGASMTRGTGSTDHCYTRGEPQGTMLGTPARWARHRRSRRRMAPRELLAEVYNAVDPVRRTAD